MRKWILAGLLALAQTPMPIPAQNNHASASTPHSIKDARKDAKKITTTRSVEDTPTSNITADNAATRKIEDQDSVPIAISKLPAVLVTRDWIDYLTLAFGGGLVLVGALGIRAAVRTLEAIRTQADLIEKQIAVSSGTLESQRCADRAWLVIRPKGPFLLVPTERFDWTVQNVGRSTAAIDRLNVRCEIIPASGDLLPEPDYGRLIEAHGTPIAPGDSMEFWSYPEPPPDSEQSGFSITDIEAVRNKKAEIVIWGYILYRDAFDRTHEYRFCSYFAVWCNEFRIRLLAPGAYHTCT